MSVALTGRHVTRLLDAQDLTPDVVTAWHDLAARAAEPNPFAEPQVVLAGMAHLDASADVRLLTAWDGNRLDAVLPVTWPLQVPVAGRTVPLPAWEALTTPYRPLSTPLVDATTTAAAMSALLCVPVDPGRPAGALAFRYFRDDGPVAAALDEALRARGSQAWRTKTYRRAVLLRDGGTPPSKNRRRRYKRIRLARERLDEQVGRTRLVDRAGDPAAVEEFLRLEASGWKADAGTALACRPAHAEWFREVCAAFARDGRLELLALESAGTTLSMECNLLAGDTAFHLKAAYDEAFSEYLPGMQQLVHLVDELPGSPVAVRDSCTVPDNTLMNQLWPDRRAFATLLVPLHGRAGSAALATLRGGLTSAAGVWRGVRSAARTAVGAGPERGTS